MARKQAAVIDDETELVELEPEIQDRLKEFETEVARLQEESRAIQVVDDVGEGAAVIVIAGFKRVATDLEAYRDSLVRPHNNKVRSVNQSVKKISLMVDTLVLAMDAEREAYLIEKQRRIDEANRLAAAKAEAERIEKERQEQALRDEAERLRKEAEEVERKRIEKEIEEEEARLKAEQKIKDAKDAEERERLRAEQEERERKAEEERKASIKQQAALEKQSVKAEARADVKAEQKDLIAPTIQFNDSVQSRTLASGTRVGTKDVEEVYLENGTPLYKDAFKKQYADFRGDDERLPAGIPMRFFDLNVGRLIRAVKDGDTIPGFAIKGRKKTTTAKAKA